MDNQLNINTFTLPLLSEEKTGKKQRSSNLELYRIVCMLMIVAHHYVVNSGLTASDSPIILNPLCTKSLFLLFFGAWGKVGINCFMLITGYFMCTSKITLRKFLKLMLQIYLYKLLLYPIMIWGGYETFSLTRIVKLIMPVWGFSNNFTSCFIAFWLTIPFWTILVQNFDKRKHELLILLALTIYTLLGSIPTFRINFNYISWFGVLFLIASYIRLYPLPVFERKNLWGWLTLVTIVLIFGSIVGMQRMFGTTTTSLSFYFVADSNKILAVVFAVCSFLWFKNMNIKYNRIINAFGAATFGVLLIHANSDAMKTWLWKDTVDCVGHYALPLGWMILYYFGVVLAIFVICNLIDQLRINTLERWFFKFYDKKYADRAESFVGRIINGKQKASL